MAKITRAQSKFLTKLCADCITYGMPPRAALEYIRVEMEYAGYEHTVFDIGTLERRKKALENDAHVGQWYNRFQRIGFVKMHMKLIEDLQRQYDDTMKELFFQETQQPRNNGLIIRLKTLMIEQGNQLEEYALGSPVLAGVMKKLEKTQIVK